MNVVKPSSFADANIDEVVEKLTTDEAISLIAGMGFWWTASVPRLGIPSIKVSDGPNGVRGGHFFNGTPANCIPCATALGATWDTELVREIASKLLASETKQRAASVLLAPTCNIQRSPLGGRSFESFAEDPHLSGVLASAYINGLQSGGVAACIKHFVANDQEHDRQGADSIVSDRALREIYLYPFMLAEKEARPLCYMTSYNKLNGTHCSENPTLIKDILRGEWKSQAMVMSDWFGVYSVSESINASLDLEMPGPQKWRTQEKVNRTIQAHKVTVRTVKERAAAVLKLVKQLCKTNPEVIDTYMMLPRLDAELVAGDGQPGLIVTFYSHDENDNPIAQPVTSLHATETNLFLADANIGPLTPRFTARLKAKLLPREKTAKYAFGLTVSGRARLYINGEIVVDNWTRQRRGNAFFGTGTVEETAEIVLEAGKSYDVEVEYRNVRGPADGDEDETTVDLSPAVRLGGAEVLHPQNALQEAADIAKDADVAIVVIGLNNDWETEGYDRSHLELPGLTNELVSKVAAANPRTVVVCQSGSAVTMPWVDSVPGLIHAWYGGNENGNAIADVLFGKVNPSGKMSMTFPKRLEDVPSYGHFGSENGKVRYAENLYVGYKHYQHRKIEPLFPFGYGLSYTTFSYGQASISVPTPGPDFSVTATVPVTNTGKRVGSEAVQLYVSLPQGYLSHPLAQLRAFHKVKDLAPGATEEVKLVLDKYAVSYWDDVVNCWRADKGTYTVRIGGSSDNTPAEATFVLERSFEWSGL
ncbi:hypothetical protein FRB99_008457 [Tulasnella sp. 403]|nr:hypothetical protein FRB99_008457 [Tulasnella sp. 403]